MVKLSRGCYDAWKSVAGYVQFLQQRRSVNSADVVPDSYEAHRARLTKARADIEETKAAAF